MYKPLENLIEKAITLYFDDAGKDAEYQRMCLMWEQIDPIHMIIPGSELCIKIAELDDANHLEEILLEVDENSITLNSSWFYDIDEQREIIGGTKGSYTYCRDGSEDDIPF